MLSCCMIVQDEEHYIRRCLDSVHPYVDEIVVVDGGSVDATIDIVREYDKVKLFEFTFPGDFGKQRNNALVKATGDWVFVIDADEYISPLFGEQLSILIASQSFDVFSFPRQTVIDGKLLNLFDMDFQHRLFQSHCRYKGKWSESITGFTAIKRCNLSIMHDKTRAEQLKDDKGYWDIGVTVSEGWEKIDGQWCFVGTKEVSEVSVD